MTKSLDAAYPYWAARSFTPALRYTLILRVAHLEDDEIAGLELDPNRIWFDAEWFEFVTHPIRHNPVLRAYRRRELCTVVVHEVGHTAGLPDGDPRDPEMSGPPAEPPSACVAAFPVPADWPR